MNRRSLITRAAGSAALAALLATGGLALPMAAQARNVDIVITAPPPLRAERIPPPRRGYVWAPGHWEWQRNHHVWVGGTWMRARPGYVYHAPQWQQRDGRWAYDGGRWDRDGDGVPNRFDRQPGNPNRR